MDPLTRRVPLPAVILRRALARRRTYAFPALATVLLIAISALAQSRPSEYAVKAAYLYNFGKFVRWPADAKPARNPNFSICVLGQDPFGPSLDATVEGETISGKPVIVRHVTTARDGASCNILYISPTERGRLSEILAVLGRDSTLTVSDMPDFTDRGGMIQFILDSGRVRFEINRDAAQAAGLNLSSELLKVAMNVRGR